jgi:hypothetical protein
MNDDVVLVCAGTGSEFSRFVGMKFWCRLRGVFSFGFCMIQTAQSAPTRHLGANKGLLQRIYIVGTKKIYTLLSN